ncbi:MAG: family 16 glycoside hydrolase [Planctomycetota bacterium]
MRLDRRAGRAPADRAASLLSGLAAAATADERALRLRSLALLVERFPGRLDEKGARTLAALPSDPDPVLEELRAAILVRTFPALAREGLLDRLAAAKTDERRIAAAELLSRLGAAADAESDAEALEARARARGLPGGASFEGFLERAARRILDRAGSEELDGVWAAHAPGGEGVQRREAAGAPRDARRLVAVLRGLLESPSRDPREGRLVFERACASCHRCGAAGNAVGPDLGDVAARFGLADLVTAVVEPDRDVSDQYPGLLLDLEDGRSLLGLLAGQTDERVTIVTTEGKREEISVGAIRDRRTTRSSIMPAGLFDELSPVAIADLIAFLREPDTVAERPPESSWSDLFDGKTLTGFEPDEERWRIERGVLIGAAKGLTESRFLVTEGEWSDFRLEAEVLVVRGNSGIQFRSKLLRPGVLGGYQADIGETWWGSLYEERGRGVLVQADAALWEPTLDRGGWNHLLVEALGEEIAISLNGVPTVVLRDSGASRGRIGLQLHAGEGTEVHFRNLRLQSHDKNHVSGH